MQKETGKSSKAAADERDWSSGEEEPSSDLGVEKKVIDMQEVIAREEESKQLKDREGFTWKQLDAQKKEMEKEKKQEEEEKKKKDMMFTGKRPTFSKGTKMGNKQEYPELGQAVNPEQKQPEKKPEKKPERRAPAEAPVRIFRNEEEKDQPPR